MAGRPATADRGVGAKPSVVPTLVVPTLRAYSDGGGHSAISQAMSNESTSYMTLWSWRSP